MSDGSWNKVVFLIKHQLCKMSLSIHDPVVLFWVLIGFNGINSDIIKRFSFKFDLKLFDTLSDFKFLGWQLKLIAIIGNFILISSCSYYLFVLNGTNIFYNDGAMILFYSDVVIQLWMIDIKNESPLVVYTSNDIIIILCRFKFNRFGKVLN